MEQDVDKLSDKELLELITGRPPAVERFMEGNPDLYRSLANLCSLPLKGSGLTVKCKERLEAAVELGRRLSLGKLSELQEMRDPATAALYLSTELQYLAKEMFVVLSLNNKRRLVGKDIVSVGTATNSLISQREIFMNVMRHNGAMFIVAHNHPSGEPKPSSEDIRVTDELRKAGSLLGIPLIDHIIIGNGEYYSFLEEEAKENN